ncbi:MAG: metal ABC transporter substrate-binding protein [Chloroflexota bacterium]|nr:metal ABC transporter substrate-binding protein [Chloroflexota bacterium]
MRLQPRIQQPYFIFAIAAAILSGALWTQLHVLAQTPAGTPPDSFPTAPLPGGTPPSGDPLSIVTTTPLLADLVRQVGGPRVLVETLLPANADPHDYEPAPGDIRRIGAANLVVYHGLGLDTWATALIDNADGEFVVINSTEGISTLASDEEGFGDGDPHVWFDPTLVQTIVTTLANELVDSDPEGESTYRARATAYIDQLAALDTAIATQIATIPAESRKLVTDHDSLAYYADRYGLEIVGTVIPSLDTRAEPSARDVAELLEAIATANVPAIFTEQATSPGLANELADQAGVALVDDLYIERHGPPGSGADTYIGLMWYDTTRIVEALRGK